MLVFRRKIENYIEEYLLGDEQKILCIDGARQVGKSFIIRYLCEKHFENYIELNMVEDENGEQLFKNVKTKDDFYLQTSIIAGDKMKNRENTIIFIDEIQVYPHLLTLLKALRYDNKYKYICSGSLLGVTLRKTSSIPIGSIIEKEMYPMDFEEFLMANSVGELVISHIKQCFIEKKTLEESLHQKLLNLFKTYLYVGGMPDAVKAYVETKNVYNIRSIQTDIQRFYGEDAAKYDQANRLTIKRIYDFIPSTIENKVKRVQFSKIENKADARYRRYENEFDYLISSGIALDVKAVSEPKFPLIQSSSKNLIKLYMNDVGLLTNILYKNNINAILQDKTGVNLGAVYETVVAQELKAHGHQLYYYDRRKVGEVDYMINDYETLSVIPIEVKSGRDSFEMRALPKLLENQTVSLGYVFSNHKEIKEEKGIIHYPIYMIMCI